MSCFTQDKHAIHFVPGALTSEWPTGSVSGVLIDVIRALQAHYAGKPVRYLAVMLGGPNANRVWSLGATELSSTYSGSPHAITIESSGRFPVDVVQRVATAHGWVMEEERQSWVCLPDAVDTKTRTLAPVSP